MPFDGTERMQDRILDRTRELLLLHGWCQKSWLDGLGRRCLGQALCEAIREIDPRYKAAPIHHPLWVAITQHLKRDIPTWNDSRVRKFEQVLDLVNKAKELKVDMTTAPPSRPWRSNVNFLPVFDFHVTTVSKKFKELMLAEKVDA